MKVIKKYTALRVHTETANDVVKVTFSYGEIQGPYYDKSYPKQYFDTEQEAIEYAYKTDKWGNWLILPFTYFDNMD